MTELRFTNNASTTITAALSISATTATLAAGTGAMFPGVVAGGQQAFQATLIAADGNQEIVRVTNRTGDVVTFARAQEGTSAKSFAIGSLFELRATAAVMSSFLQKEVGGAIGGDIDLQGHNMYNVKMPDVISIADLLVASIRGPDRTPGSDTEVNIMRFPPGKDKPTLGGHPLLNSIVFAHIVFDWTGNPADLEPWWKFCDGTQGTPDLRDKFILGATQLANTTEVGAIGKRGGSFDGVTEGGGEHNHSGVTLATKLEPQMVPSLIKTSNAREDDSSSTRSLTDVVLANDADPHTHGIKTVADHTHAIHLVQPYYRLAKVMLKPEAF